MKFYLGTHLPTWLAAKETEGIPLFVSHRRLAGRRTFPRAHTPWALDSGGFSELSMFGEWRTSTDEYVESVRRYTSEIGNLEWAAVQDWMCEPWILKKTGLTVEEHQRRTVISYDTLTLLAPEIHWVPVLQGWHPDDYVRHIDIYEAHGIYLQELPLIGLGSVCRRQHTDEIGPLIRALSGAGARLHGFGFKSEGLRKYGQCFVSADSMAWSVSGRYSDPLEGCVGHKNCANCIRYALLWREWLLGEESDGVERQG